MENTWSNPAVEYEAVTALGRYRANTLPEQLYGILGALLIRSMDLGEEIEDTLDNMDLKLPDRPYRVMILALDDPKLGSLTGAQRHACRIDRYSAIRTRMTEQIGERADGFLFLMFGYLIGLVYLADTGNWFLEACRELTEYSKKQLGYSCHVTISVPMEGVQNIERANKMVQDIESSRQFYAGMVEREFQAPESALDRVADQEQKAQFEQTFFETAERICGTVRAGETASATEYLRTQLLRIAENSIGLPYPTALNLTVNRFIYLMQYKLAEQDLADWRYLETQDYSRELISCPNLTEFLKTGEKIAEHLVSHARHRLDSKHDSLMRDIRTYLEENATDINIGLTAVARTFRVKPRDAAESFRQYYGISVNDVIHRARVKKAKELILTTDDSIQSIAEAVGYCSLATMYRAFTNLEGVAPGKLRQNKGN